MGNGQVDGGAFDGDILNLFFPKSRQDKMVWLLGLCVLYVCDAIHVKEADDKLEEFFGYLTFKFEENNRISKVQSEYLPIFR